MRDLINNIKVHIVQRPELFDQVDIYILRNTGDGIDLATFNKTGVFIFNPIKEADEPNAQPTLKIPKSMLQKIIDAFTEVVPPIKQAEIDSELKATKYHLEDMRKLMKL